MESTRDSSQTKLPKPPSPKSIRFESSRNISFPTLRTLFSVKHSLTQFINKQRNRPNNEDNYYKSLRNSAKSNNRNFNTETKYYIDEVKINVFIGNSKTNTKQINLFYFPDDIKYTIMLYMLCNYYVIFY